MEKASGGNIASISLLYTQRRDTLIKRHKNGIGGIAIARTLTTLTDTVIKKFFVTLPSEHQDSIVVVATGGYGRSELCFFSDIDVVFLCLDEETKKLAGESAKKMLHHLLTLGVTIGHSFRTIDECIAIMKSEPEPAMSLMEARYICGNALIYGHFQKRIRSYVQKLDPEDFISNLYEVYKERHKKYGTTSQLLEPNIKNSAGGLRDLHTALWLMYGTGFCEVLTPRNEIAVAELLLSPAVVHLFPKQFLNDTLDSYAFLLRTRNEMHLQAHTLHDTLEFSFQPQVAQGLSYRASKTKTAVEHFMEQYHKAARTIERFTQRLFIWAKEEWKLEKRSCRVQILDNEYYIQSDKLFLRSKYRALSPAVVLRAFWYHCKFGFQFSFELEDRIHRLAPTLKPTFSKEEYELLRNIFNNPVGVAQTIRLMSELGVLERWIPEWKKMRAFYQHNQYHYYTADEHTLRVLQFAEDVSQQPPVWSDAYRKLPRKDTLMFACLLHDIAKPFDLQKHETFGKKLAGVILGRLGFDDITDDVAFLVRHHLSMEQVAFRRNLEDEQTIIHYAKLAGTIDRLRYLFVLTYSDLRAVNPTVFTSWKESLLVHLYKRTLEVLESKWTLEQLQEHKRRARQKSQQEIIRKLAPRFGIETVQQYLSLIEMPEYVNNFTIDEISTHIEKLRTLSSITVTFVHREHWTEVTFYASDAPFLLTKLCGILTANDANILDAHIVTLSNGKVIDKFRVADFAYRTALRTETCEKIAADTQEVFAGTLDLETLLANHQAKWKRKLTPLNLNTKSDVVFSNHPHFTIIDVYGPDSLGFLYRITKALAELGCNIRFAKIATRLDGVVDSFYVLDSNGNKITNEEQQNHIRNHLLTTLTEHAKLREAI